MMQYRRILVTAVVLGLLVGALVGLPLPTESVPAAENTPAAASSAVQSLLKSRLNSYMPGTGIVVQSQPLHRPAMVRSYYARRDFRPVWTGADGSGRPVTGLLPAVEELRAEALVPESYHLQLLHRLVHDAQSNGLLREEIRFQLLADMDLLATDAFFTGAAHLLNGRVTPETLGPEQQAVHKEADLFGALDAAADTGRAQPVLESFLPNHDGYRRLRRALQRYRRIVEKGGWVEVADGAVLRIGRKDERVSILRSRLIAEGYLEPRHLQSGSRFDGSLKQAVMVFQRQHGLTADGAVGRQTIVALNEPPDSRVRQIELNMERWRWLPRYLGKRYLLVNIADYRMEIVDTGRQVMVMRVAVGRDYRRTPVFSAQLNKIVLNPHWYVPPTIFAEDLLPAIRIDPDYLEQRGYKVFDNLGPEAQEVDPQRIDWQAVDAQNFPYILRKDPGPFNPMGRVKFLFPNRYNVYLHDAPDRTIFRQPKRTFSSGCIRIEKPIELAEYLLKDSNRWSRRRILAEIESGRPTIVGNFDPLPIYIQYWTAWVDEKGAVQFRDDIYGRDAVLQAALSKMTEF